MTFIDKKVVCFVYRYLDDDHSISSQHTSRKGRTHCQYDLQAWFRLTRQTSGLPPPKDSPRVSQAIKRIRRCSKSAVVQDQSKLSLDRFRLFHVFSFTCTESLFQIDLTGD
jgi:hypothetical protein